MDYFAIVVIITREDRFDVSNSRNEVHGIVFAKDVLILITS